MNGRPWRERLEIGLAIEDELGSRWVPLDGEDFYDRIELAVALTEALGVEWVPVFCHCANVGCPVSVEEVAEALGIDAGDVVGCLLRLEKEDLVERVESGAFTLSEKRRGRGAATRD